MIKLELSREETRVVNDWIIYLLKVNNSRMSITNKTDAQWLATIVAISLLEEIQKKIFTRLINKIPRQFRFSFSYAHGAHLMIHLMGLPIPSNQYWLSNTRQRICNEIHQQIFSMKQTEPDGEVLTLTNFTDEYLNTTDYE